MRPAPSSPFVASSRGRLPPSPNALQAAWLREMGLPRALMPTAPAALQRDADERVSSERRAQASEKSALGVLPSAAAMPSTTAVTSPNAASPSATSPTTFSMRDASPAVAKQGVATSSADAASSKPASAERPPSGVVRRPEAEPGRAPYVRVPGAIERAPLADLRTMVDECEGCELSATRRHTVFGVGPERAAWMVVGEAPGEQEDLQGRPFVGKSGQLLTQMLRAVGVDRETDVFIANVIKCRPPGNRNPKPEEIAACRPFLMRQIEVVAPRRLLVLGRFAAQVLVGADANLNALRGKTHTFIGSDGRQIPMIVSFHPAYLLRSPQEKAKAWRDLQLAAALTASQQV